MFASWARTKKCVSKTNPKTKIYPKIISQKGIETGELNERTLHNFIE
jgi:hypothetical protein